MKSINKWYIKHKDHLLWVFIFFLIFYFIGKILDYITPRLAESGLHIFTRINNLHIAIPADSLVIGAAVIYVILKYRLETSINKNRLKILSAKYGANNSFIGITDELNKAVRDNKLVMLVSNDIGGDPIPGVRKVATIHYEYNGKKHNININESEPLILPTNLR